MTKPAKAPRPSRDAKKAIQPAEPAAIGVPARKNAQRRTGQAAHKGKPERVPVTARPGSKLGILETLLRRQSGMTIADACEATGWQAHSVRGAIAGALKKRGLPVVSQKIDGVRTYHITAVAP